MTDVVNHPKHYADLKGDAVEDLKKARFYIDREIECRG